MTTETHKMLAYEAAMEDIQREVEDLVSQALLTVEQGNLVYDRIKRLRKASEEAFNRLTDGEV